MYAEWISSPTSSLNKEDCKVANMAMEKTPMPEQAADIRNKNFEEVTLGYTEEMAVNEAKRCLNCKNMRTGLSRQYPYTGVYFKSC